MLEIPVRGGLTHPGPFRVGHALGFGQTRGQDPHELRGRRRPHLGPCIRQVVLHGRVRQTEAVGGRLLRSGDEDCGHDHNLTVRSPGDREVVRRRAIRDRTTSGIVNIMPWRIAASVSSIRVTLPSTTMIFE